MIGQHRTRVVKSLVIGLVPGTVNDNSHLEFRALSIPREEGIQMKLGEQNRRRKGDVARSRSPLPGTR